MKKTNVIQCLLALLMVVYLAVMLPLTRSGAAAMPFSSVEFVINDSINSGFVNAEDIRRECLSRFGGLDSLSPSRLNLADLEFQLGALPEIESINAAVLSDGTLRLDVVPMIPVARVFERNKSYYINRMGKKIVADINYHIDVPVVSGYFDESYPAANLLPLLDYIKSDPALDALVSSVNVDRNHDIYLIPVIRGHVVNFGDTTDIPDKFARLEAFYSKVMPVKGWDHYDSLSVKWRGQMVATRRIKTHEKSRFISPDEFMIEDDNDENLTTPLEYPKNDTDKPRG